MQILRAVRTSSSSSWTIGKTKLQETKTKVFSTTISTSTSARSLESSPVGVAAANNGFNNNQYYSNNNAQYHHTVGFLVTAMGGLLWHTMTNNTNPKKAVTWNHCQVPCGIFDDPAMVSELKQAAFTIRKAIQESKTLHSSKSSSLLDMNQIVRWITTKEQHCNEIIHLISDYCLCQRVKRVNFQTEQEYLEALKLHHIVMQAAMKAKQSMDIATCDALDLAIGNLAKMYTK